VLRGALVAVLVLVAGCGGFSAAPAEPRTDTLSPVPVPSEASREVSGTTAPSDSVAAGNQSVPGVTGTRLEDPFALVNAHVVGTTLASYTVRRATTVRYPNGTLRTRETTTAHVGSGGERYQLSRGVSGPAASRIRTPPGRFDVWTDGERFLSVFRPHDGQPEYARISSDQYLAQREYYSPPPRRSTLLALLAAFEVRAMERRPQLVTPTNATGPSTGTGTASRAVSTTGPGTTASANATSRSIPSRRVRSTPSLDRPIVGYRLVGTAFTGQAALGSVGPGTEPRNATLELYVDTRGRIRQYDLSYTAVVAGERMRVTRRSRYEVGGVRVGRPDWYGTALAATNVSSGTPERTTRPPASAAR